MRVISWNVNRAGIDSPVWDYLLNLSPDIALLQEIGGLSPKINDEFEVRIRPAIKKTGEPSGVSTGVLVKAEILGPAHLSAGYSWVNNELSLFDGHLVACVAQMNSGEFVNVISVHSPWWYVRYERLAGIDISPVARTFNKKANRKVYVNDLLWAVLKDNFSADQSWIVGGDNNTCETLRGSSPEFVNRMRGLGLTECLRPSPGDPIIPTFCHSKRKIDYQLDHLFVSPNFRSQLQNCVAGDHAEIFFRKPKRLSDHLPIIADFGDCAESKARGQKVSSVTTEPEAPLEQAVEKKKLVKDAAWALAEAQKQFGPTARVWTTAEVEGCTFRTLRYRTGFLDDGVTPKYVETVNGVKYRMKGVGASWSAAVESGKLFTMPTSYY